jgi:hypothetical protein
LRWVLRSVAASSALAVALLGLSAAPAGAELAGFAARTGAANPLNGQDVGNDSAPSLGDFNGDGDLDLVTGNALGTFNVHYLPEPGRGLLLGAGVALLKLLGRLRGRRSRGTPG